MRYWLMGATLECLFPDLKGSTGWVYGCRCPRCSEWAMIGRRMRKTGQRNTCNHPGCEADRRPVQGSRYCEEHATPTKTLDSARRHRERGHSGRGLDLKAQRESVAKPTRTCAKCGHVWPDPGAGNPYSLCGNCRSAANLLVKRASRHSVPAPLLLQWLNGGTCDLCSEPLRLAGFHNDKPFAIDHDHTCCPGELSCGGCVRGLLCLSCNTLLGRVEALRGRGHLGRALDYLGYQHEDPCQPETELTTEAPTTAGPRWSGTTPTPTRTPAVGAAET